MTISNYYNIVQAELLLKRQQILEFINVPKLLGDFYEEIIRDYLRSHLPPQLKVLRGVVADPTKEITSKECDITIYNSTRWFPLFKTENMAIIPSYCVESVIEVKSEITTDTLKQAKKTLQSVRSIESSVNCFLVGYSNSWTLESAREEFNDVGVLIAFSDRKRELIPNQLRLLMDKLEHPDIPIADLLKVY